jgi:CubicO group peptidase (beta-lactamase class C family)
MSLLAQRNGLGRSLGAGLLWALGAAVSVAALPQEPSGRPQVERPAPVLDVSDPARIDALLAPLLEAHSLPAIGGAVVSGGRLAALGAAGVRKKGAPEAVTVADLWHLGSCTKAMTATLTARLVERGVLRFESTLGELLAAEPGLELAEGWGPVTVAELLRHRGRAPADLSQDGLWAALWRREGTPREQRTRLLRGVLTQPPSAPAAEYLYSNAGYALVGALLERLDGRDFEQLLTQELFLAIGADGMGFGAPGVVGELDQPRAHRTLRGLLLPQEPGPMADNPPAIAPAGTVHASLSDWARFVALHLAGARGETQFLLPETFAALYANTQGPYALGWGVRTRPWARGRVLTHSGSNTMWHAVVWIAPELDLAFLAVTNRAGDAGQAGCDAAIGILRDWALDWALDRSLQRTPEGAPGQAATREDDR